MSHKVGYTRVSTLDQSTERQLEGIKLDKVFEEKASGKDVDRPVLQSCLAHLREGDTLYVHSMDRLARKLDDLRKIVQELNKKDVTIIFVKEGLTFNDANNPCANLMLSIIGAVAEFERALIKERQREGIAIAKAKGVYKGRKPSLTKEQVEEIKHKVSLKIPKSVIARDYGISRETLRTYLNTT